MGSIKGSGLIQELWLRGKVELLTQGEIPKGYDCLEVRQLSEACLGIAGPLIRTIYLKGELLALSPLKPFQ